MTFAGTNLLAIIIAAAAAFIFGGAYYGALSKQWAKAARLDAAAQKMTAAHFATSIIAELIMAFVLARVILLVPGVVTDNPTMHGITSGFFMWLGFVLTSMAMSHRYQGFGWDLTLIDALHWLGVLVLMGAIIGWFGVSA